MTPDVPAAPTAALRAAPATAATPTTQPSRTGARGTTLPRYGWRARLSDWRQARADARAGLPSLEPGRPVGTPAIEEYHQDFLARCHRERLRLDLEVAPMHQGRATIGAQIPEAERALAGARARLDAMPVLLSPDDLDRRRAGEQETPEDVVAARRAREYEALRRPLVDAVSRLESQLTAMRVEQARLASTIRGCELAGATRVRRLHAQVMRRVSAYERHLVRRHPAGDRIGPVLAAQHPVPPGWVGAAELAADQHAGDAPRTEES